MRTPEEKKWAEGVLAKANGKVAGAKEVPGLIADYESTFEKSIKPQALKCWLWRLERKTKKNKPSKGARVGGRGIKHSDEENQWALGVLSRIKANGRRTGLKAIKEMGIREEFKKQFGRELSGVGLYTWLRTLIVTGEKPFKPFKPVTRKKKRDLVGQLMDEITKYLLVVNGVPVTFDSAEALKTALENPEVGQVVTNVRLFTSTPINIDRKITVSIGK